MWHVLLLLQIKLTFFLRFRYCLLSYLEVTLETLDTSSLSGSCFVPRCAVTFIDILLILINAKLHSVFI